MREKLFSRKEVAHAAKLDIGNPLVDILYRASGLEKVNQFYHENEHLSDLDFINGCLDLLEIKIDVSERDLERIPENGAFIAIANHPYGALDGLLLMKLLASRNKDFKVMANILLNRIPQLEDRIVGVNPFDGSEHQISSFKGMKHSLVHLRANKPLGIFPSGEVSTYRKDLKCISDGPWDLKVIKLIQKAQVPVIPIYFEGGNSRLFHLLGRIHPSLRTIRLPAEFSNKKGQKLRVRIGKPVKVNTLNEIEDHQKLARYLRAKTYALGTALKVKKEYFIPSRFPSKPKKIKDPIEKNLLTDEINKIHNGLLFSKGGFECYIADATAIPSILSEIGRLREKTFREVGEGTNRSIDLDEFDLYYQHLFLWDKSKEEVVGAYRIGKGAEIMHQFGPKGFYTRSIFKMDEPFNKVLFQSIELGRSFIQKKYQKERLPLFLLWKGILVQLVSHPEYRYVLGPVTISGQYQSTSKELIISFIKRHYFQQELSAHIRPRTPFQYKKDPSVDLEALLDIAESDLKKMDQIISEIEPSSFTMPVLLKKYLHQNAKILGFNLDPKFNNALDGLMLLDLHDLPAGTIENLQREFA